MAQVRREIIEEVDDSEVAPAAAVDNNVHGSVLAARIVSFIGGFIMTILALRFLLSLLGANRENTFADLIYSISQPFVAPFFGLFSYTPQYGVARFEFETLIAILVYALLTAGIVRLVTIGSRR